MLHIINYDILLSSPTPPRTDAAVLDASDRVTRFSLHNAQHMGHARTHYVTFDRFRTTKTP